MKLPKKCLFMDEGGRVVLEITDIFKLPLKEERIIAKSVEMFNDPEPCVIHKSAVIKRMILDGCAEGGGQTLAEQTDMPDGAISLKFI